MFATVQIPWYNKLSFKTRFHDANPGRKYVSICGGIQRMNRLFRLMLAILFLAGCAGVKMITVRPKESNETLINPGRGFASSFRFNDEMQGVLHPHCTVAQFSFYWDELEPVDGEINFGFLDSLLSRARINGQKLNFRVMCQNGRVGVPQWLRDEGLKGHPYPDGSGWQPEYDDPLFLEKHSRLIRSLAERYDGHPDIDCIDIASLGRWGEWHTWETGDTMPSKVLQQKITDLYLESFRTTPLVMQIGGGEMLARAVKGGAGWRADCFGDMGEDSAQWSHMRSFYQQALDAADASLAWKNGPVVFESCWTMQHWYDKGWDIDYILSEALRWHGSVWSNKSEAIPEQWWPKIVEFEKKMGYRFTVRQFVYPSRSGPGDDFTCRLEIENTGVAPCYHNFPPTLKLESSKNGYAVCLRSETDIKSWMPGLSEVEIRLAIPGNILNGSYVLSLALLDTLTGNPAIHLANEGIDDHGWLNLGQIEIH